MNFKETLDESLDGLWNNRQYGGVSELPRKDYQPYTTSNGYSFPYQAGSPPVFPPTAPEPETIASIPWPLEGVTNDLADGFVYLFSALNKMKRCLNENPSLNKKQKEVIKIFIKMLTIALVKVKKIGNNFIKVANLAEKSSPSPFK